jgi:hypothetical protein
MKGTTMNKWIVMMAAAAVLGQPVAGFCMPKAAAQTVPEQALAEQADNGNATGKVLETMNSGGYTYINLQKNDGKSAWYAVPVSTVTVGSTITILAGVPMGEFYSKSLKQKFDNIVFSPGIASDKPGEVADKLKDMAHKGVDMSAGMKGGGAGEEPMGPIKVEKAAGTDAYTVAELFGAKGPKAGNKVAVRGKVVKASSKIMGRTWLHLQDGSGDMDNKDNDLVVTSQGAATVGEVVTVHGTLARDKDFGAGYRFSVIVEDAEIAR